MILVKVPSGKIEIVQGELVTSLQFNCSCTDALPYCHALCCRMRPMFAVQLTDEEAKTLPSTVRQQGDKSLKILPAKGYNCAMLENDGDKCGIYADRPAACRDWHCSPGGNPGDESIKVRDNGWGLFPSRQVKEPINVQRA